MHAQVVDVQQRRLEDSGGDADPRVGDAGRGAAAGHGLGDGLAAGVRGEPAAGAYVELLGGG